METEHEQHPWTGKLIYMDFGTTEVSGTVVSVDGTVVTMQTRSGLTHTEDYADAGYVEVEDFGVIDI